VVDILFALSILSVLPCALCGKNDRVSGEHATKELTVSGRLIGLVQNGAWAFSTHFIGCIAI
jgi:hypothetical protein